MALTRDQHRQGPSPAIGFECRQDDNYGSLKKNLGTKFLQVIAGRTTGKVVQTYCTVKDCIAGSTTKIHQRDGLTHPCDGKDTQKSSKYAKWSKRRIIRFADLPLRAKERMLHGAYYSLDPFHKNLGDNMDAVVGFQQGGRR